MIHFLKTQRKIVFGIMLLIVVIVLIIAYFNRPGTVSITTETGADIYVSTERGGEYKKIGTGDAKYSTRKVPITVYVSVTKGDKKTLSSTHLLRGDNKKMKLSLKNRVQASKLYEGALSYVNIEGPIVQGILPDEYSIVSFRTDREEELRPEFVGIPYLSKIVWYDANNFVYRTFDKEVGLFKSGTDLSTAGMVNDISLVDGSKPNFEDYPLFYDVSKYPRKPLVAISSLGVFLSDNMGTTLKQIVKPLNDSGDTYSLFTTENNIFLYKQLDASEQEETTSHKSKLSVNEYDYTGKLIKTLDVPGSSIKGIVEKDNIVYILTDTGLVTVKDGRVGDLSLYFSYVRDIVLFKGKLLILGDEGLWLADDNSLFLMYSFDDGAVGLSKSISVSGDKLIFGSQQDSNGVGKSETFVTSF